MFLFLGKSQPYVCNISLLLVDKTRAKIDQNRDMVVSVEDIDHYLVWRDQ